jgi:hypothetical protein
LTSAKKRNAGRWPGSHISRHSGLDLVHDCILDLSRKSSSNVASHFVRSFRFALATLFMRQQDRR